MRQRRFIQVALAFGITVLIATSLCIYVHIRHTSLEADQPSPYIGREDILREYRNELVRADIEDEDVKEFEELIDEYDVEMMSTHPEDEDEMFRGISLRAL